MYSDLMVDLEYLASDENAVITQIAAVPFDITNGFYAGMEVDKAQVVFDESPCMQDQLDNGRTIDASTMAFWMNQCAENGKTPNWLDDSTGKLVDILYDLITWGGTNFDWGEIRVWSHIGCDMNKMNHAYRQSYNAKSPWSRGHEWHLQTLRKLAGRKATADQAELIQVYRGLKTHDAVDDCVAQIKVVTLCWDILGMES